MSNEIQSIPPKRHGASNNMMWVLFCFFLVLGVKIAAKADKKSNVKCSDGKENTVLKYKMRVYVLLLSSLTPFIVQ